MGYGTTAGLFGVTGFCPDLPQQEISTSKSKRFPAMENAGGC